MKKYSTTNIVEVIFEKYTIQEGDGSYTDQDPNQNVYQSSNQNYDLNGKPDSRYV